MVGRSKKAAIREEAHVPATSVAVLDAPDPKVGETIKYQSGGRIYVGAIVGVNDDGGCNLEVDFDHQTRSVYGAREGHGEAKWRRL